MKELEGIHPSAFRPVQVVIPVYRGIKETHRCLESVMATLPGEKCGVTVIDDASPEPGMAPMLKEAANRYPHMVLLHNTQNIGFVGTVNKGISHHPLSDIVLLNSDTLVAGDWLHRLRRCAYGDDYIGTVTPFSNNATICSYPRFCADNPIPSGWDVNSLHKLFTIANDGRYVEIPTAVGFCMYIRRDCLDDTGLFDIENFGRGYGEENDFCMRARRKGWKHVLCADTFVFHAGGCSFGEEKKQRELVGLETVMRLHPEYSALVQTHIQRDPARPFRQRVDLLRFFKGAKPAVLFVSHYLGGGVTRHVHELAKYLSDRIRALLLRPAASGMLELSLAGTDESFRLFFDYRQEWDDFLSFLREIGISRIHFHHLLDQPEAVTRLPQLLNVPYDVTVHDYHYICPRITLTGEDQRYCEEPNEDGCGRCLPRNLLIELWRDRNRLFFHHARHIFAPSLDVIQRIDRYFPQTRVLHAPHPDLNGLDLPTPVPIPLDEHEPLRIVVLGALSQIKGAEILDACARNAKARELPLRFCLIGYGWRSLAMEPESALTVTGPYREEDLPSWIERENPHLVWFPAQWPETYSYTLSACLAAGLPVVASNIGAFPERLGGRPWSWICQWDETPEGWNAFFMHIRENHFRVGRSPEPPCKIGIDRTYFSWERDYHTAPSEPAVAPIAPAVLSRFVDAHSYPTFRGVRKFLVPMRLAILRIGLRLRTHPWLVSLVRRIPHSWQYAIRDWLRR